MFWGLVLEPSKKYTQQVDQTFHISQAALDLKSCDLEPVQLVVEYENSNFVLATLSKKANIFQVPLDLIFRTGDEISFRTIGNGKVHLSGYHVLEDIDSMLMNGEEESDVEDEEEEVSESKGKRKKSTPTKKGGKKPKLDGMNEDESEDVYFDLEEDDEDFDDDSEEDDEETTGSAKKLGKKQTNDSLLSFEEDDDDDDDDDEEDEDEDDVDEEDEEDENDDEIEDDDESDMDEVEADSVSNKKENKVKNKKVPQTPNGVTPGKNQTPQKQAKNQKQVKSETKQKGEKKAENSESTPDRKSLKSGKKEPKTPKSPKGEDSPRKKVLQGGVISEDIVAGTGPVAKPGKMVNVYYVGTLASNKKEFDSVKDGGGFRFRLGRNEVIKGWDIGVIGMKVGGKRKLTIPPHLAYGAKGCSPLIPPNSTLVFTVELKGIS